MLSTNLDDIDRKLFGLLQMEFPLTAEPYSELGLKLGITGNEVTGRIHKLKAGGLIREISPVLDGRKLGYQSTLAAMKIPEEQRDKAEMIIAKHPGVSHGYERTHDFNIWITLSVPQEFDIQSELEALASSAGAEAVTILPAVKIFKLRAYFDMGGDNAGDGAAPEMSLLSGKAELSRLDRLTINELQKDLSLTPAPFAAMSSRLNMDVASFLAECESLLERGIIRRFGASVNHRRAGYLANAMACWVATPEKVDIAAKKLAARPEVSHCYERKTSALWRYNLFAMIHGLTRTKCLEIVDEFTGETGFWEQVALFSTKEFKKTRIRYQI